MSVGAEMVVVREAFVEHCVSLVLGHTFECSWLDVSQTDLFHCSSLLEFRQLLRKNWREHGQRTPRQAMACDHPAPALVHAVQLFTFGRSRNQILRHDFSYKGLRASSTASCAGSFIL